MDNYVAPGKHLIIDFWDVENQNDLKIIEQALTKAAEVCGATVLDLLLHEFGEDAGITGVAVLKESHISIHTWPEISYVALDVFMCGHLDAYKAIDPLKEVFKPNDIKVIEHTRGQRDTSSA